LREGEKEGGKRHQNKKCLGKGYNTYITRMIRTRVVNAIDLIGRRNDEVLKQEMGGTRKKNVEGNKKKEKKIDKIRKEKGKKKDR
jgi:hypothetical protein